MKQFNWVAEGTFDDRIDNVLTAIAGLARALESDEDGAALLAAAQVHRTLEVAERTAIAIGLLQKDRHPDVAAALQVVQEAALPLLERVPLQLHGYAVVRRFLTRFKVEPLASTSTTSPHDVSERVENTAALRTEARV